MDQVTITSAGNTFTCDECKNDNSISDKSIGDIIECEHCGIEYKIMEKNDVDYTLELMEEEK